MQQNTINCTHIERDFRLLHICHVQESEISPHDRFFSTDAVRESVTNIRYVPSHLIFTDFWRHIDILILPDCHPCLNTTWCKLDVHCCQFFPQLVSAGWILQPRGWKCQSNVGLLLFSGYSPFRITAIPIPIPDYSYSPDTQKGVFWIVCIDLGMGQGRQLEGGTGLKAEKRGGDGGPASVWAGGVECQCLAY